MGLEGNVHQGLHGEAFVYALACAAGLCSAKPFPDFDGVDWQIGHPGPRGTRRSPKIEVQVKTWSNPVEKDGHWQYRLRAPHYNSLAGSNLQVPRFLALVIVPQRRADYARCDAESMRLSRAGYWLSLADREEIPEGDDPTRTVAVAVPKRQLLTVETLSALVDGDLTAATI